ncbi:MAG: hypothetical protein INQ03_15700 [Candidatus Heimdallarchaeota archaeon]|nr:hypothetical protein [Candidatus Heimdallarchaeota archaeon]
MSSGFRVKTIILGNPDEIGSIVFLQNTGFDLPQGKDNRMGYISLTRNFKVDDLQLVFRCYLLSDKPNKEQSKQWEIMKEMIIKGTNAAIVIFDVSNRETFDLVDDHFDKLKQHDLDHIPTVLIGLKYEGEEEVVTKYEAEMKAVENNAPFYLYSYYSEEMNDALDHLGHRFLECNH